jgi:hypothetical protein
MDTQYHIEICRRALQDLFSTRALKSIITANLGQDKLRGQFGHPEFHFDHNAFNASYAYMEEQRCIILNTLSKDDEPAPSWYAFGRLVHTWQDFYAHSNYLSLWADSFPEGRIPDPFEVDALNPNILNHPQLKSGKIYLWDYLAYVPGLHKLAMWILPKDSHGHMNLDHPERGQLFPYAVEAAIQRTIHEFELISSRIKVEIGENNLQRFTDC